MKKANYGGAYDILPSQYWTREDLTELENAIDEKTPSSIKIQGSYIEKDVATILYMDSEDCEWKVTAFIDKRIAGTTKELCEKYGPRIAESLLSEVKDRVMERIVDAFIDNNEEYLEEIGYCEPEVYNRDKVSYDVYHRLEIADNDFIREMCEKYRIPCDYLESEDTELER